MQEYQPRLLIPDTKGVPAHIALGDDPRVYDELRDPQITAAVYTPNWSAPVQAAFKRLAALPDQPERNFVEVMRILPAFVSGGIGAVEDFLFENTARWLRPVLNPDDMEESVGIVTEVSQQQTAFVQAASQLLRPNAHVCAHTKVMLRSYPVDETADTRLHLQNIGMSKAHTDPGDTGLFAYPIGTVLVDQTNLDIERLRTPADKGNHRIGLSRLANRLWQMPDGSFGLWRNTQYHLFPELTQTVQRYRVFAFA